MIFRIQPFVVDKSKFGECLNWHCSLAPTDDTFIQLMDYDAMILSPKTYKVINEAIFRYPDTAIFSCMTNRVAYQYQMPMRKLDEETRMEYHIKKAEQLAYRYADGECTDEIEAGTKIKTVAGFFMLFRKSYWKASPFQEHIYQRVKGSDGLMTYRMFDSEFCRHARESGMPIRIIKGVYVWHTYRLMQKDYREKKHLML